MGFLNTGFYNSEDLRNAGFKSIGDNVLVEKNCTVIGFENIEIGNNVRIDGYTSIIAPDNGYMKIGSYIHIGAYSFFSAGSGIVLEDFVGISQGVKVYSRTDDFSGEFMTNPMVDPKFTNIRKKETILKKHSIIGSSSIVLPGANFGTGASVGANSLVTNELDEWSIYGGSPAKKIKDRSMKILELEEQFLRECE